MLAQTRREVKEVCGLAVIVLLLLLYVWMLT